MQGVGLNHLAFADDLILFSRGDVHSITLIMDKLTRFGDSLGLKASLEKSDLYVAGINSAELQEIKEITGFKIGCFLFRYLGIPIATSRLTIGQFSPLVNKITEYINSWAGNLLSFAGRTELLRSVLQGVECFWLSTLPTPEGVKSKVTSLCRNFLWGGKSFIYKKPLISWKTVCLPKTEGGLGLKCLKTWNKALLSKSLWNLQAKKDSLWVKWINHFYFNKTSTWDYQVKKLDSALIKQILHIRDELLCKEGSALLAQKKIDEWSLHGKLNVRIAYKYFRPKGHKSKWTTMVWDSCIMPKHAFTFWLAVQGKLKTKDKLLTAEKCCVLCKSAEESVNHLFFDCSFVKQIWDAIKRWLNLSRRLSTLKAATKWLIEEAKGTGMHSKTKKITVAATVYIIWETRNMTMFEDKGRTPAAAIKKIQVQVYRILSYLFPEHSGF